MENPSAPNNAPKPTMIEVPDWTVAAETEPTLEKEPTISRDTAEKIGAAAIELISTHKDSIDNMKIQRVFPKLTAADFVGYKLTPKQETSADAVDAVVADDAIEENAKKLKITIIDAQRIDPVRKKHFWQ